MAGVGPTSGPTCRLSHFVCAEPEEVRVGLGIAALARLLVALGPLHLPGARELQGLGPKAASWPKIVTVNPYLRPQVGPTSGPTL
jgi:hypothetical protein